ncbi:FadR/GntR family transcriptional regulator [Albibacterium bauzanense]|uniref:DNA-binding FadR family transcriptional regulator n=1 Tax=Albibacterium bauzanense TaxID=653929 RepID=A0A4R1LQT2_9SPHI|nr:GntR family transcriptional regulator [Albibacterium bauzanense]TCK80847.1 DNA-binding FadR family transcriptional regulator [Albibacterium bauzanense]
MKTIALKKDLKKINSPTMADIVELKLMEFLKKTAFQPGDALPKEMELAEALGVSRNVVREGLSRLKMLGLIESRKRRGMVFVRPDILSSFEKILDPIIMDETTLKDIFELRLVLEMGLGELLYRNKTDKDIAVLEKIAKDQDGIGNTFRIKHELAFHGKLYEIAGNETLKRFQIMLLPIFAYVTEREDKPTQGTVNHADLVEILKHGTKEDFNKGMLEHLKPHFDRLENF